MSDDPTNNNKTKNKNNSSCNEVTISILNHSAKSKKSAVALDNKDNSSSSSSSNNNVINVNSSNSLPSSRQVVVTGKEALFVKTETTPETPLQFQWIRPRPEMFFSEEFKKKQELSFCPGDITMDLADLLMPPPFMSNWVPDLNRNIDYVDDDDEQTSNIDEIVTEDEHDNVKDEEREPFDLSQIIEYGLKRLKSCDDIKFKSYKLFQVGQSKLLNLLPPQEIESSVLTATENDDEHIYLVLALLIMLPQCFIVDEREDIGYYISTILIPSLFRRFGRYINVHDMEDTLLTSRLVQLADILVMDCRLEPNRILEFTEKRSDQYEEGGGEILVDEFLCCVGECFVARS